MSIKNSSAIPTNIKSLSTAALACAVLLSTKTSKADISTTGQITDENGIVTTINTLGHKMIGYDSIGTLVIDQGSVINDSNLWIGLGRNTGGDGSATITGADTTVNINSLSVGDGGVGNLLIEDGANVRNKYGIIRAGEGLASTATVTGQGSVWYSPNFLINKNSTLNILDGGYVYSFNATRVYSNSTINISGEGSHWSSSSGIDIFGGSVLNINQGGALFTYTVNASEVNINGDNSYLSATGFSADLLDISQGGKLKCYNGIIGGPSHRRDAVGVANISGKNTVLEDRGALHVGEYGTGILNITDGAQVKATQIIFGHQSNNQTNNQNVINITGEDSSLVSEYNFNINRSATLNITDNATADITRYTVLGAFETSSPIINFDNGTLNTTSLITAGKQLLGNGTINTKTIISDFDLTFDNNNNLQQQLMLNAEPNQQITINLDYSGTEYKEAIGAGATGNGSLTIADGKNIKGENAYFGYYQTALGVATIKGENTTLDIKDDLIVGHRGKGDLSIEQGASVISKNAIIASFNNSSGTVTVTGEHSTWVVKEELNIGRYGHATLHILNGAIVKSGSAIISNPTLTSGDSDVVNLSGVNSVWENKSSLGIENKRILNITDGGKLVTHGLGLGGKLSISDEKSMLINSGDIRVSGSDAELKINRGGTASSFSATIYGCGTITVDGPFASWTNSGNFIIWEGKLNIINGASVKNTSALLGGSTTSNQIHTGEVTVSGIGSTWTNYAELSVGYYKSGILNINDYATVNVLSDTSIGLTHNGTGVINFNNGTLNTIGLVASGLHLNGNGVINTYSLLSDIDLVFDNDNGYKQQLIFNSRPNQNIIINLDMSDTAKIGAMGAGLYTNGSLTISDGKSINATKGYLGYAKGSKGVATISGENTTWSLNSDLLVGIKGDGILNISDGASVVSAKGLVGPNGFTSGGSTGTVNIEGENSNWNIGGDLSMGYGEINIAQGGQLSIGGYLFVHQNSTINLSLSSISDTFIHVDGEVSLYGKLNINFDELTSLEYGQKITLLDIVGDRYGSFQNINDGDIIATIDGHDLIYNIYGGDGNDIELFVPELADLNADGRVNHFDIDIMMQTFGTESTAADVNKDGQTDLSDLFAIRNSTRVSVVPIPEPASSLLLLIAAPFALYRRN